MEVYLGVLIGFLIVTSVLETVNRWGRESV